MKGKSDFRQKIAKESEVLTFGKFKHCTVQYILHTEPSYILWLDDEKIVEFHQEILDKATDAVFDMQMDRQLDESERAYYFQDEDDGKWLS